MALESYPKVKDNGNCDAENVDAKLTNDVEVEATVGKAELFPGGSIVSSPSPATKGRGLKKWRRIHRESGKETTNNFDSNKKRGIPVLPVGTNQRSEGSSSSTNAMSNVLGNALDRISLFGDLSSRKGSDFASRADSENSRSSTGASAPRGNLELPVLGSGFKGISVQLDQQEKGGTGTKKPRGAKIKKENSISSMESDSRSSNSVFFHGATVNSMTRNGRPNGRSGNYDEDDSDDARNADKHSINASQTTFSKNKPDYENVKDLTGENSWEVKEEKIDDPDALDESMILLHLAQEALEREVQNLKDVGKDDNLTSEDQSHLQRKLEEAFLMLELKNTKISELESTIGSTQIMKEYDKFLTRRIAAELEYLVISETIQNLKAGRISITVEQKNDVSATARSAEKEDDKTLKNRVWRYVCRFIIQLVLLNIVLRIFGLKFLPRSVEIIPT